MSHQPECNCFRCGTDRTKRHESLVGRNAWNAMSSDERRAFVADMYISVPDQPYVSTLSWGRLRGYLKSQIARKLERV
jgi:hypothetical protein